MKKPPDTSYCTLYIMRHAETEANASGILGSDTVLTEKGKEQAKKAAERFKDIHFDTVYTSDLIRTQQTAEFITLERKIAFKATNAIRERYYGKLEGSSFEEYRAVLKEHLEKIKDMSDDQRIQQRMVEGMETEENVISRLITFLREIALAYPGKNVLIVSHGNVMRVLLTHLGFVKHNELPIGAIENTGVIKLTSDGVDFFIEEVVGINRAR